MITLAEKLRPMTLEEFIGQKHILSEGKIFRKMIEKDKLRSIILYGPAGTGKTTLARITSNITKSRFKNLNATKSGVKQVRDVVDEARIRQKDYKEKTIIFIDEIHSFNKIQQDILLPYVEQGVIILIGATTQNPYFSINGPLLSRSEIFEFKKLTKSDLLKAFKKVIKYYKNEGKEIKKINKKAINILIQRTQGDVRKLYNVLEIIFEIEEKIEITEDIINQILPNNNISFDFSGEERYDGMSAIQNSIQFSDPHSAIYWLAWCINRGEDINIICRRLLVTAAEDVGLADPQCLPYVTNAIQAAQQVGFPEAAIILSSAVAYLGAAPRSKASAKAIWEALSLEKKASKEIPNYLKDCHYQGSKKLGRGLTHDGQHPQYYDSIIEDLFKPENGFEIKLFERLTKEKHQEKWNK